MKSLAVIIIEKKTRSLDLAVLGTRQNSLEWNMLYLLKEQS